MHLDECTPGSWPGILIKIRPLSIGRASLDLQRVADRSFVDRPLAPLIANNRDRCFLKATGWKIAGVAGQGGAGGLPGAGETRSRGTSSHQTQGKSLLYHFALTRS